MKNVKIYSCLIVLLLIGCNSNSKNKTEKKQKKRNNIVNIEDNIIDIKPGFPLGRAVLCIVDDILIVTDIKSNTKGIHLFNKNTFDYIVTTGIIGRGPGEIGRYGTICADNKNRALWMTDYEKMVLWRFSLDSVLNNELYKPSKVLNLSNNLILERYGFLNDSIVLGKAVDVVNNGTIIERMVKLNIYTNKTAEFGYVHPKAIREKSRSFFKISLDNNLYVNCYSYCDLMTICDLDGNLRYNVYGPGWLENKDNKMRYFGQVDFINNSIIAAYSGDVGLFVNEYKRLQSNYPSKFIVFDLNGNYVQTIETGFNMEFYCIDNENKRVIVYFEDRDPPLGYFNFNLD